MRSLLVLMVTFCSLSQAMVVTQEGRDLGERIMRVNQKDFLEFKKKLRDYHASLCGISQTPELVQCYEKLDPKTDDREWILCVMRIKENDIKRRQCSPQTVIPDSSKEIHFNSSLRTSLDKFLMPFNSSSKSIHNQQIDMFKLESDEKKEDKNEQS